MVCMRRTHSCVVQWCTSTKSSNTPGTKTPMLRRAPCREHVATRRMRRERTMQFVFMFDTALGRAFAHHSTAPSGGSPRRQPCVSTQRLVVALPTGNAVLPCESSPTGTWHALQAPCQQYIYQPFGCRRTSVVCFRAPCSCRTSLRAAVSVARRLSRCAASSSNCVQRMRHMSGEGPRHVWATSDGLVRIRILWACLRSKRGPQPLTPFGES